MQIYGARAYGNADTRFKKNRKRCFAPRKELVKPKRLCRGNNQTKKSVFRAGKKYTSVRLLAMIRSPCIEVCRYSGPKGWCLGCFMTIEESRNWKKMKAYNKKALLKLLDKRRESKPTSGKRR